MTYKSYKTYIKNNYEKIPVIILFDSHCGSFGCC